MRRLTGTAATAARALVVLALAACWHAGHAQAQAQRPAFSEQEGRWSIEMAPGRCFAVNRPLNEVNASPYNLMMLSLQRGRAITVSVHFWPGQFTGQEQRRLTLVPGRRPEVIVPAVASTDFALETREPLTADFFEDLRTSEELTVRAQGVSQVLVFDIARIGFVIARLENCARLL